MAELKYLVDINLLQNQLIFPKIHSLGTAPTSPSPVEGQLYFDSSAGDKALHVYNGSAWVRLAGQISAQTVDTIATGDKIAFSDESQDFDVNNALTVDNLFKNAPKLVSTAAIANGDFMLFLDGGATGEMKKEAVADIATLFAGAGMTATDSVLNVIGTANSITVTADAIAVTPEQTTITSILNTSLVVGRDGTDQIKFGTDNQIIFRVGNADGVTFKASGEIEATSLDISGNADIGGDLTGLDNITSTNYIIGTHTVNDIDITSQFVDADDHIMSSKAIGARFALKNADTTGNADTATALAATGNIAATGDVVWNVDFSGPNVTAAAAIGTGVIVNTDVNASAAIVQTKIDTNVDLGGDITFGDQPDDTVNFTGHVSSSFASTGSFGVVETPYGMNFTGDNHSDQGAKIFYTNASSTDKIIIQAGTRSMIEIQNPYTGTTGEVVINEDSLVTDFRVESGGNDHMIYSDGNNDRVGIGKNNPTQVLDVNGNVLATSLIAGSTVISDDSIVMTPTAGDTFTIASATNGATTLTTVDTQGAEANLAIIVDGLFRVSSTGIDIAANGTISSAVWNGTKIADAYLSDNTAHLTGAQTFSGAKTFGTTTKLLFRDSGLYLNSSTNGQLDIVADTKIQIATPDVTFTSADSNDPIVSIINTNNDATGASLKLIKNTANSAANNDVAGIISFLADDAGNNETEYGRIKTTAAAVTAGSESGKMLFGVATTATGAYADILTITGGATAAGSTVAIAGNLTVAGTTTTQNTVLVENTVSVLVFEGVNADAHATTLKVVKPTATLSYSLPNLSAGDYFLPAIVDAATDASAAVTAAEFALLDGGSTVGTTATLNGDGFVHNDAGTMRHTNVHSLATLFAGSGLTATNSVIAVDTLNQDTTGTASKVTVTDSSAGTAFPVVFHDESDSLLDDTGAFEFTPESGALDVPIVRVHSSIQPNADDGATIGTTAKNFSDIFLADAAVLNFGDDQDVKFTHVHDTGLLLNSTMAIQFNDASQYIKGSSATELEIGATNQINLESTLIDINGNVEISGTATTTGVHTFTEIPSLPINSIDTAEIAASAVETAKIDDAAVTTAKINDVAVTTGKIANGAVTLAKIADDAVDEANLKVSNTPTNGYVLTAQSGNTGGLTWAEATGATYKETIGDATSAVAFEVTHSLNTKDVMVQLYDLSTLDTVYAQVIRTTVNTIDITFNVSPTNDDIRVLVTKI